MLVALRISVTKLMKTSVLPKCKTLVDKAFSDKYLLWTNVGVSVTLSGVGDVIEQKIEMVTDKLDKWDSTRTRNMSITGASVGALCHYWYYYLDKFLPGYSIKVVVKKILIDQFVGSPLSISTFFITINLLENSTKEKFYRDVKEKSWRLYLAEWMIWPPAQFVNFYLLPLKFRVLFDNGVSLGYDVYTSYVQYNTSDKGDTS